ncbi:MAG TPA: hypothetical protein VGR62_17335 [Candidatus Binatia bacterium]|jgi:hypothetical protein|nr:hypothetical protein [Candidatus Binatia bacterium]
MRRLVGIMMVGAMLVGPTTAGAVADPTDDAFNPGTDLTELSACQSATALVVHLGFADAIVPIVMSGTPPANALVGFVDIDSDRDSSTGNQSNTENYGPMGAGTELGIEGYVDLGDWNPDDGTLGLHVFTIGETARVPATFTSNGVTIAVPIEVPVVGGINVATVVGTPSDPTDVGPNTGFVTSGDCCGNGTVDPGEDCDGGTCCSATCTFADGTSCSDGDACTTVDHCAAGTCTPTGPADCDDGDACFDDSCDAATGCAHAERPGFAALTCVFERALPISCIGQAPFPVSKFGKAQSAVDKASAASGKKRAARLKKARKLLRALVKGVDGAQARNALTIECADGVRVLLEDALSRLERVLSGRAG